MIASRSRQQIPQNPIRGPASVALEESQSRQTNIMASEISPDRTFGSEELIALHVLRTSLKHPNSKRCPYYTNTVSSEDESSKIDDDS